MSGAGRGWSRGVAAIAVLLCLLSVAQAATVDCQEPRPAFCEEGYVCIRSACLAALRVERDDALADLAAARIRARRFHADLTCGPGISTALDRDFGLRTFPTPGACVVGLAIRLGK